MVQFYYEYRLFVYKLAWQHCDGKTDAEDLAQEVWEKLCTKEKVLFAYSKKQQIAYISAVVRNTAVSFARKEKKTCPLDQAYNLGYNEANILNEVMDRQMKAEIFYRIWPSVPESIRELLERKYLLLESDAEIAAAMGIGKNSVRMYLSRARKTACAILSKYKNMLELQEE